MTSSADTRETTPRARGKRVAGSRRRPTVAPTRQPGDRRLEAASPPSVEDQEVGARAARRHTRLWSSALAAALALGMLVAALVVVTRPALTDRDRSAAVGSARTTLEALLSYSGSSFDEHVATVTPRLAPPFKEEFAKVAATDIKPLAVKNGATVLAKVYDAGVMDSTGTGEAGSTVRVLAFVNQATTTTARKAPQVDQNRVIATMVKVGDRWLVSRLDAF